jgi:hypothetical protein
MQLWGTIQHVEAPGPSELVHYKAKQEAAQHAAAPDELARMGSEVSMLSCPPPASHITQPATAVPLEATVSNSTSTACCACVSNHHSMQARSIIDQHLLETGSLLLQGLPIKNPEACEAFVNGMGFTPQKYEPYGGTRQKVRR